MLTQLTAERQAASKPRWSFLGARLPRYVMAAVVVAVAVLGAGLLLRAAGQSAEAATIEGVVVDNSGGTLTVQTLDALEQVEVPAGTSVSDVAGAQIGLGGIEVGQVVVVDVQRRGKDVVAQRIQRYRGQRRGVVHGRFGSLPGPFGSAGAGAAPVRAVGPGLPGRRRSPRSAAAARHRHGQAGGAQEGLSHG